MALIQFDGYIPPNPSTYEVEYSDVNAEESQVEDGTTYSERVRTDVPAIKVGWTNITQADAMAITDAIAADVITVAYFYGTTKTCDMRVGKRQLKLKLAGDDTTYWDLSFELQG